MKQHNRSETATSENDNHEERDHEAKGDREFCSDFEI